MKRKRRKRTRAEKILIRIQFLLVVGMAYIITNIAVDKVLTYFERYLGIIWGGNMKNIIATTLAGFLALTYIAFYTSLIVIPILIIINR